MLEPVHGNIGLLIYKVDTYRGQEEDKQEVLKIVSYKDINNKTQYKVKWIGYNKTTQKLLENLKNAISKVQEYQKRLGQKVLKENRLGNIEKELKIKGLVKSNRQARLPTGSTTSV